MKSKKCGSQSGFGAVELTLILLVVVLTGAAGWLIYNNQHKPITAHTNSKSAQATTKQVSAQPPADPYDGWKTAVLQYEKITYKYPADWTVTDNSVAEPKSDNGCIYPGVDEVTLTSPSNEQVIFSTGIFCIGDGGASAYGAVPVHTLGQNLYLVFENNVFEDGSTTSPAFACLARSAHPNTPMDFSDRNIFVNGGDGTPASYFCYYPYNETAQTGAVPNLSIEAIKGSKDYQVAVKILESLSY